MDLGSYSNCHTSLSVVSSCSSVPGVWYPHMPRQYWTPHSIRVGTYARRQYRTPHSTHDTLRRYRTSHSRRVGRQRSPGFWRI
eukprot:2884082-Rhodomonas_salina.7